MKNILTTLGLEDGTVLGFYSEGHADNISTTPEWQVERPGVGYVGLFDIRFGQRDIVSDSGLVTMTVDGVDYATNFHGELVA